MTKTDSTEAALLAAVRARPEDDVPRLALADWMEEHPYDRCRRCDGHGRVGWDYDNGGMLWHICPECRGSGRVPNANAARAEFIRVQCEVDPWNHTWPPATFERKDYLRARERELFTAHAAAWWPGERAVTLTPPSERERSAGGTFVVVRRGFPAEWWGTLAAWCGADCGRCDGRGVLDYEGGNGRTFTDKCDACHGEKRVGGVGPAVLAAHPTVTLVLCTDRMPMAVSDGHGPGWTWSRHEDRDRFHVPDDIHVLLPIDRCQPEPLAKGYKRWMLATDTHAALSAALISLAKGK